ncbi:MAG TPA: pectate lyase [Pyrinomonadaceae bacterium]|jgi:PelA/Pel-15E family pectate lyase
MRLTAARVLLTLICCAPFAAAQTPTPAAPVPAVKWDDALRQKPDWYATPEAVRVADNVLLYQYPSGGWPKNIDMAAVLSGSQQAEIARERQEDHGTIDNGATYTQLNFLARVYNAAHTERHKEAFLKGMDYLLKAQYANGGWPQYYPLREGYYTHITYNDGAMIGVMRLLRDIAQRKSAYAFVDAARRARAAEAVAKGVECILKTQVLVGGQRTIWGAQHDEVTLAPAAARRFEPISLASLESVDIVRFLMQSERPDARVVEAVEGAVAWFKRAQLSGIRWVERRDPAQPSGYERMVVADPHAPPLWARFYEIGTNRPVFEGRDNVVRYSVAEIEPERRNGYRWYTDDPARLLDKDYPAWRQRWRELKS